MKFKKQICIVLLMSLLLTSCSLNLKAGIIKHEDKNERIEEKIEKTEDILKKSKEVIKEEKVSEKEKKELVAKMKNEFEKLVVALSETTDEIKIKELLKDKFENCTSVMILNIYFATEDGEFHLVPEQELPESYDSRERSWYSIAKEYGESTASFFHGITGDEILNTSYVVKSGEKVLGVLGVDINLENNVQ